MKKKPSTFARLLASTFTEEELAFLKQQPHFDVAIETVRCFSEFERVCAIGQRLLAKRVSATEQVTA